MTDAPFQPGNVVVIAGDMVTAAQIYPLHFLQNIAEFLLNYSKSAFQIIGILLAESMKMQTGDAIQVIAPEVAVPDTQP